MMHKAIFVVQDLLQDFFDITLNCKEICLDSTSVENREPATIS